MRLLLIHSDYIEYEIKKKAISEPEKLEKKRDRFDEALTVFSAVEKIDEKNPEQAIKNTSEKISKNAEQLQVKNIMIYPYAHLSSNLGKPKAAKKILADLEKELSKKDFNVKRSPFGWYKSFKISCKGHPLSELSKEILPEKKEETAAEKEREVKSQWCILTPEGKVADAEKFDFTDYEELKKLYEYESEGSRESKRTPAHVKIMKKLELVDYEPASDSGNFRWYPKGHLVKGLLEDHINDIVQKSGGMQVETPIMYDVEHPALSAYLKKFPARQYTVQSDKDDFFLRFAACFGQYMIMKDMTISYHNLPLRLYELTHYSFRREQSGELSGLRRLRSFTMPDLHTLCGDLDQAQVEFAEQFSTSLGWMNDLNLDYEVAVRFVKDFFEENKDLAKNLAKKAGKPILLELWDERYFYFVMKFEFNVIDTTDKASALSTVQIDVENAERFNINFVDEEGEQKNPYILHSSFSGSIDRCLYAILEREAVKMEQGMKPMLPFWLSPTQIRFIPVKDEFISDCKEYVDSLKEEADGVCIRCDIDDREETVSRKIRDAEKEWTPIIIVVGDRELENNQFKPRFRRDDLGEEDKSYNIDELADLVVKLSRGYPQKSLPLPIYLSKRPQFTG